MKHKNQLFILLAVLSLILASLACGSDNTGEKVGEAGDAPTNAPPKVETYNVGDIVKTSDQTITLNNFEFQGNRLIANFTIENQGTSDAAISTLLDFTARDQDGSEMEIDIFDCTPDLGGSILPGDKIKGNVCFSGTQNATKVRIYYEAELFGSGAVVWEITK